MNARLGAFAGFAGVLSAAGLPIYIHAPKFYVDSYGVSLVALGSMLFALRLLDVVQDPVLGRLADALRAYRAQATGVATAVMAAAMFGLFAIAPPIDPLWWFAAMLALVFSCFSFLTIAFYATGVAKAGTLGANGHLRLARWRESGALIGVCLAALAPSVFDAAFGAPFIGFAVFFALACGITAWFMAPEWRHTIALPSGGFGPVLRDRLARRLLLLALVNAAPVAVSSTLFLFFVESVLGAPGFEGPLLVFFFLAAALSVPVWGFLAERFGARPVLLSAMVLAIAAFSGALTLGAGDVWLFALVCLGSGVAMGADMTLLPALFARRMATIAPGAAEGFALWTFVSKFTLAFAAAALLPMLQVQGFEPGGENSGGALQVLSLMYAGVPCCLKLVAIGLLLATDLKTES